MVASFPRSGWVLGPERRISFDDGSGFYMRLHGDIRKCVVFLGHPEYGQEPNSAGISVRGTGFLLAYDEHTFLVTARHVAIQIEENCAVRVNTKNGGSITNVSPVVPWKYHPDPSVDVAVSPFGIPPHIMAGLDALFLPSKLILTDDKKIIDAPLIELGDLCYTVGLFRVLTGKQRNLPVVHTGNLARMPGEEPIPIKDELSPTGSQLVDGYLVETQSLSGLSGSPVFIRRSHPLMMRIASQDAIPGIPSHRQAKEFMDVHTRIEEYTEVVELITYTNEIFLLGLFQAAWEAPASDVTAIDRGGKPITVPVGMGVVVPSTRIIEVLELPDMKEMRNINKRRQAEATAATPQSVGISSVDDNPDHLKDFTRLVDVAARKRPQGDQT